MGRKTTSKRIKGNRLKTVLKNRGYSISKTAIEIGYTREAISKSINNNRMDITMLDIICKFLNISPRYIEGIENEISTYNIYSVSDTLIAAKHNKYDLLEKYLKKSYFLDETTKEKRFLKRLDSLSYFIDNQLQENKKGFLKKIDSDINKLIKEYSEVEESNNGKRKKESS